MLTLTELLNDHSDDADQLRTQVLASLFGFPDEVSDTLEPTDLSRGVLGFRAAAQGKAFECALRLTTSRLEALKLLTTTLKWARQHPPAIVPPARHIAALAAEITAQDAWRKSPAVVLPWPLGRDDLTAAAG